jgi:thermolysin
MLPERVVERFDQFYNGVPIWGADVVRDSERGVPIAVFGELASPDLQVTTDPTLTGEEARTALLRLGGPDATILRTPTLVIARLDSGEYRLTYTAVVSGGADVVRMFVDAQNGAELIRYSEIQGQQPAVGVGTGVLGDRKKLSTEKSGGTYVTFDRHRPPILQTFDMRGNLARSTLLFAGRVVYVASDLASDSDNVWTDVALVDAHVHVAWTYDYYYKRFGRTGLDGRNAPVNVVANAVSQQGALSIPAADLDYAINAFWCGSCGPGGQGMMFFGNGLPPGVFLVSTGRNYTYLSGALDIASHELTHAVTQFTSGLLYQNESGALNEAFSDMMGKSVEFFYHPPGTGAGQADYVVGKDVVRAVRVGALNGIRSMSNPTLYDDPDHYSRYRRLPNTEAGNYGGVHTNSGIPNHVFYLAIEGGTNRTSGLSVQGVGPANREQIEKVFYRTFTTLLPRSATFSMARIASVQAARDLYGAGSAVERAVTQAWDAVGVTNTSSNPPTNPAPNPTIVRMPTLTGTVPADDGRFYYYTITMPFTGRYQAVLNWSDPTVDLDLMISLPGCTSYRCQLTRAESATRRPETICLEVRAGEQYWLRYENWSPRSTSYEITQRISPPTSTPCSLPAPIAPSAEVRAKTDRQAGFQVGQVNQE